jgi:hypothetical protein
MQQYHVYGILNQEREIIIAVEASTVTEAMNGAVEFVKEYRDGGTFDIKKVELKSK